MSTDHEWEKWGKQDPYFGVITQEKYRYARLDAAARAEFFESGAWHVDQVWSTCRQHIDPQFAPNSVLDFGCGVGRLLLPLASRVREVVGVDVADSMLLEARRNCDLAGLQHVQLLKADDGLTAVTRTFDLVHSTIVLQHIAPERGLKIMERLLGSIAAGGVGAIQITYAKMTHADKLGIPGAGQAIIEHGVQLASAMIRRRGPIAASSPGSPADAAASASAATAAVVADPEMQMNSYHLNQVFFILQNAGITRVHSEFTDHGGELGVFLFFRREVV